MNLQPINPSPSWQHGNQFRFACRECGKVKVADERTHADLNASPFSAYVCGDCLNIPILVPFGWGRLGLPVV